jgi:hypothetical protein
VDAQPLIKFPCHCGYRFALPIDQANSTIQCPNCRRLNDVPSLSDLQSVSSEDGTLLLKETHDPAPKRSRMAEVDLHFRPRRVDDAGNEIDLRPTLEELADVGALPEEGVIPLLDDEKRPQKPKYDPVTGELIRPLTLARTDDMVPAEAIPVARPAHALAYASGEAARPIKTGRIFVELCMPVNVVVMLFILVMHVLDQMAAFAMMGGFFFIVPAPILITMVILAHYGNTLEDTGPDMKDELPRPMRGMSIIDDIWKPFVHLTASLIFCYAPAFVVLANAHLPPNVLGALTLFLLLAGSIFFPAVFLTLCTSGTIYNLRPDRVLGVIRAGGRHYAVSAVLWLVTSVVYLLASTGSLAMIYRLFTPPAANPSPPRLGNPALVYPILMTAIFLAHFFCWHLGLLYREKFAQFPWILQKHVSARAKDEAERAAKIRAQRRMLGYAQKTRP